MTRIQKEIVLVASFLFLLIGSGRYSPVFATATAALSFAPSPISFQLGTVVPVSLRVHFTNGSVAEKLDYFMVQLSFNTTYIRLPAGQYIDTGQSGFKKIISVDGPTVANQTGKIKIEIAALTPGDGPSTIGDLTIATIPFEPVAITSAAQSISITASDIINNQSQSVAGGISNASYTVESSSSPSSTPGAGTATSTPSNPTPTTGVNLCQKSKGDANCDGSIDVTDYEVWRTQFDTLVPPQPINNNANFSCIEAAAETHFVDLADFEAWRRNTTSLMSVGPSLTPSPTLPYTISPAAPTETPTPTPQTPTATPRPPTATPHPPTVTLPPPTATPAVCTVGCYRQIISLCSDRNNPCECGVGEWQVNCGGGWGCYSVPPGYSDCGCSGSQRRVCEY